MQRNAQEIEWYERFRQFGAAEIRPGVRRHDDEHLLDRRGWKRLGEMDFFRLPIRTALGGLGHGLHDYAAALEGVAEGSSDLGFSVSAVAHMVCLMVLQEFGSAEQHRLYLPRLLSGEWIGAVANAEPQAGTNLMAIASQATRAGDGFELSAEKQCITNIGVADLALVSARLRDVPARQEVNVFLVETAATNVEHRPLLNLEGLRTSCTGDLRMRRATLSPHGLLGPVGAGLEIFRSMFVQERLFTGVLYLSALHVCTARALEHAETRQQFGRPIGRNQHVQERIVRMRVGEQLLRSLLHELLDAVERGEDVSEQLSMVKVHGIESAIAASEGLMRLLGGRGMSKQEMAEKYHRDLLALSVLGGTVELHKMVIYQELARRAASPPQHAPARTDLTLTVHDTHELPQTIEKSLIALTARLFPDEPALQGRFYYDTRPDLVVAAWKDGELIGFRMIVRRLVDLAPGVLRVAGLGIGVDSRFQRQGIGRELTRKTLDILRELNDDLALAILIRPAAEPLLRSFGFHRLRVRLTYNRRDTGELIEESMPAYALDLAGGTLVEDLNARGFLHLGVGTW
jgi:alkylation response protein AidB-like acyl-CoA dehydrogenase/GNAT superfamily N-acetyltransferase